MGRIFVRLRQQGVSGGKMPLTMLDGWLPGLHCQEDPNHISNFLKSQRTV
jgi:hypothetical protein